MNARSGCAGWPDWDRHGALRAAEAGMTTVEDGAHITGKARRLPGAAATFLIFLLAGPLIGGATMVLGLVGLDAVPPDFAHDLGSTFFFSCLTVALPVVFVGALVAVGQARTRPLAATPAVGLGATVGVVWGLFLASEGTTATLSVLAFLGATVATPVCWWLARLIARPK